MRFPKTALLAVATLSGAVAFAQDIKINLDPNAATAEVPVVAPTFTDEQAIESFGWFLAHQSGLVALGFNESEVATISRGMAKAVSGQPAPQDFTLIGSKIQELIGKRQEVALDKMRQQGLAESVAFMTEVRAKAGVVSLPNGLAYEVISAGTGPKPREDQIVTVNYVGRLISGVIFDRSGEGAPVEFNLGGVISGWREGLVHINQGSKAVLFIPPHLAYGDSGSDDIPPSSTLIFEIELLEVKDAPKAAAEPAPTG